MPRAKKGGGGGHGGRWPVYGFRLPPAVHAKLHKLARESGLSASQVVELMASKLWLRYEKEKAKELGPDGKPVVEKLTLDRIIDSLVN